MDWRDIGCSVGDIAIIYFYQLFEKRSTSKIKDGNSHLKKYFFVAISQSLDAIKSILKYDYNSNSFYYEHMK